MVASLSSSHLLAFAVTCKIAVRKACGLTKPETHVTFGKDMGVPHHSSSCARRFVQSASHPVKVRLVGQAFLAQVPASVSM